MSLLYPNTKADTSWDDHAESSDGFFTSWDSFKRYRQFGNVRLRRTNVSLIGIT